MNDCPICAAALKPHQRVFMNALRYTLPPSRNRSARQEKKLRKKGLYPPQHVVLNMSQHGYYAIQTLIETAN